MKVRNIVVAGVLGVAAFGTPAMAQTADNGTYVGGETTVRGGGLTRTPGQVDAGAEDRGSLPITGGDVAGLVAIGAAAVGTGTFMVRRSRRRPANA